MKPSRGLLTRIAVVTAVLALYPLGRWLWPAPLPPVPQLAPPSGGLNVFHLGHSLVGQDMPYMLAQLAPKGHHWNSQLGSGTSLKEHWEPDLPIRDFDISNRAPAFRPARAAISSGEYDAVVLTEMVELDDAIRYFDSADYFHRWADLARAGAPKTRIYLYETWHHVNDPQGWDTRIAQDLNALWLRKLSGKDIREAPTRPAYLIPAGQVMAAVARAITAGDIDGLRAPNALFARNAKGERDTIHINDLGAYLVALTHFAVLYQSSPQGLPHQLTRADGSAADSFSSKAAGQVQRIVWETVLAQPRSGIAPGAASPDPNSTSEGKP